MTIHAIIWTAAGVIAGALLLVFALPAFGEALDRLRLAREIPDSPAALADDQATPAPYEPLHLDPQWRSSTGLVRR